MELHRWSIVKSPYFGNHTVRVSTLIEYKPDVGSVGKEINLILPFPNVDSENRSQKDFANGHSIRPPLENHDPLYRF